MCDPQSPISNLNLIPFFPPFPSLPSALLLAFLLLLALAPAAVLLLVRLGEEAQVGAFFGAGSLALVSLLTLVYLQLRRGATGPAVARGRGNLLRMALRNAARNPGRSALAIGLTASACFLIAAVSVFRIDPARQAADRSSGSGGFALIGQSALPIHFDLDTPQGRKETGFDPDQEDLLAKCRFYSFRVKPGDEASCLNLYQPRQPRLLGVGRNSSPAAASPGPTRRICPIPGNCWLPTQRRIEGQDDAVGPRRARSDDRQLRARSLERTRRDISPSTTPTIARSIFKSPGC